METKEILDLFEKFENSSLSELAIKKGDVEVMMKKGGSYAAPVVTEHQIVTRAPAVSTEKTVENPEHKTAGHDVITAPMVGTFFRAPAPDAPPFVDVGTKMKKGQTVCILEAMKLMNELEADFDCEIVKILVENGKMVEYGMPLFEVKKS